MKKIFFVFFVILSNPGSAQKITGYSIGINYKNKHEIMEILRPNEYLYRKPDQDIHWYWNPYFGIKINDRWTFSLEYSHETIFAGYRLRHPKSSYGGGSVSVDIPYMFTLNSSYSVINPSKRFNLSPGLGFTYVYSIYGRHRTFDGVDGWGQKNDDGTLTVTQHRVFWKETYGFMKNYFLLNANLKFSYRIYKSIGITFNSGYVHGFRTIGYFKGWYKVGAEPKVDVLNASKGSNYYFSVGTQFDLKSFKVDLSKIKNNESSIGVSVGLSSLFEYVYLKNWVAGLNLYYGPTITLAFMKISTDISLFYANRNFHYNINKYAILEEDYIDGTKTQIEADVNDKVLRFQQSIYYRLYTAKNMILDAGVGYFIQKPYDVSGERIITKKDGNKVKLDINEGKNIFGLLGGVKYSLYLNNRFILNSSLNYQLYKGRNNYFYYPIQDIKKIYDDNFPEKWWKNKYILIGMSVKYRLL